MQFQGLDKVEDALSTSIMDRYAAATQSDARDFVVEATKIEPAIATLLMGEAPCLEASLALNGAFPLLKPSTLPLWQPVSCDS